MVGNDDVYERLAVRMDGLANGFPRTEDGAELGILRHVFSEEEATVAAALTGRPTAAAEVARRSGIEPVRVEATLADLADRDVIWTVPAGDETGFRLAPFMVGFYEEHLLRTRDTEFARLVEEYFIAGGSSMMSAQPAMHRVVPARGATDADWVLPYDDVRAILGSASSFRVGTCDCRLQQDKLGTRSCDFPLEVCLVFSFTEGPSEEGSITREEALAVLDEAERVGLVHTVSNVAEGVGYVCNCCGCCCAYFRGLNEWGIEHAVAEANYFAEIDGETCEGCGTCAERCHVGAIYEGADGVRAVRREWCIGCGLCVTGCPSEAAHLRRKPESQILAPPATFDEWERVRLEARGLGKA
jgi:Na+-translocating ferredoxin:NAD+ oxidoreductase subunit B